MASNNYLDETKQRKKLVPAFRKGDLWKPTHQEVYIAHRREVDIWGEQGKPFSGIASASETSNEAKKAVKFGTAGHATELTDEMVDSLGGYLDNLAVTVTNRDSKFEHYSENFMKLANSIVTLMDINKKQQSELQALHKENANLKNKVTTLSAGSS